MGSILALLETLTLVPALVLAGTIIIERLIALLPMVLITTLAKQLTGNG